MHSTRQSTPSASASACFNTSSLWLPTKLSRAPALTNDTCSTLPSKPATWPFWLSRIQVKRRRFFTASRICGHICRICAAPCCAATDGCAAAGCGGATGAGAGAGSAGAGVAAGAAAAGWTGAGAAAPPAASPGVPKLRGIGHAPGAGPAGAVGAACTGAGWATGACATGACTAWACTA